MSKLRAVMSRRWPIFAVALIVGAIAGVLSSRTATEDVTKVFTVTQTVLANRDAAVPPLIAQDALKITAGEVPAAAAERLKSKEEPAVLAATITTEPNVAAGSILVSTDDTDGDVAQKRVEAFVESFLDITNAELQANSRRQLAQIKKEVEGTREELADFDKANPQLTAPDFKWEGDLATQILIERRRDLAERVITFENTLRTREFELNRTTPYNALTPSAPVLAESGLISVPTSITVRVVLMSLLGLLLGGVATVVLERVNRRIDTREELAEAIDLPILTEIGHIKSKRRQQLEEGLMRLEGSWAEPYRRVRSAIQFIQESERRQFDPTASPEARRNAPYSQVFLITSTSPGEGKSTTTALTSVALAEIGIPTLIIGGDFRKPSIDRLLGVAQEPSLQDFARMDVDRPSVDDIVHTTKYDSLYVAPAGKSTREVSTLVGAVSELVDVARERGATIVVDSSPLLAANDTLDLLPVIDYVILVVRAGRSSEQDLLDTVATLRRMDSKILGIVLIGTNIGRKQSYYYDYYNPEETAPGSDPTS